MIVRGIEKHELIKVVRDLPWGPMKLDNLRAVNNNGTGWAFKLTPMSSDDRYARMSASGRRGPWACYHAFRDFHRALWAVGVFSINTLAPGHDGLTHSGMAGRHTFHSVEEFDAMLLDFARVNVGSILSPASYIDLCDDDYYAGHGLEITEYALTPKRG